MMNDFDRKFDMGKYKTDKMLSFSPIAKYKNEHVPIRKELTKTVFSRIEKESVKVN